MPVATLRKYRIGPAVLMEEREDGLFLRPIHTAEVKLSWSETAEQMAMAQESWDDWDVVASDGLEDVSWKQ